MLSTSNNQLSVKIKKKLCHKIEKCEFCIKFDNKFAN